MYYFIDLDGTLLDVSTKFYNTYSVILTQHNQPTLEKELYWELKRNKTPEEIIRKVSGAIVDGFSIQRKNIIETDSYQQFDLLHDSVIDVLKELSQNGTLVLVTLRNSHDQVLKQLKQFELLSFFKTVLSSGEETNPKWSIKTNLINSQFGSELPEKAIFIGDTETDILAGKNLGFKTVGVLNGMRNYELISEVSPDFILPSIKNLLTLPH